MAVSGQWNECVSDATPVTFMFTHQRILLLRASSPDGALRLPLCGWFRDYQFVRTVMEVKRHLLRCVRKMRPAGFTAPDLILVDAGVNNHDIKSELERWIDGHPRLRRIKIILPPPRPWAVRTWTQVSQLARRWFGVALSHVRR